MTPQQVQRMMDFILQSQTNFFVRMERWEEESEKRYAKIDEDIAVSASLIKEAAKLARENAAAIRVMEKERRAYERRMRAEERKVKALEARDRRTRKRITGIKDLLKLFNNRQDLHSKRIARLEDKGR